MKKVMLFWVLAGLIAGLARAQTSPVRLVWEKELSGGGIKWGYRGRALWVDSKLGQPRVTVILGGNLKLTLDTTGNVNRLPPVDVTFPKVDSGLAVGVSGEWDRIVAVQGSGSQDDWHYPAENRYKFERGRILIYDLKGRLITRVATPNLHYVTFSPFQSRTLVVLTSTFSRPSVSVRCYDRDGRELWKHEEALYSGGAVACAEDGTTFSIEALGAGADFDWNGRFYDREGKVVRQIKLEGAGSFGDVMSRISKDGRYVAVPLFDASEQKNKLYFLCRDSSKVLWRIPPAGPAGGSGSAEVSPDGRFVAGGGKDERGNGVAFLMDRSGREIWREVTPTSYSLPEFLTPSCFVLPVWGGANPTLRLYKIEE